MQVKEVDGKIVVTRVKKWKTIIQYSNV
jgi:hypothetical protein